MILRRNHYPAFILGLALLVAAAVTPASAADGYEVIVNAANPVRTLTRAEVARHFLKKTMTWPSGKTVVPVDQPASSSVREAFSRDVLGKSISAVSAFWQQQIFSGRAVPPVEKANDAQVIAAVVANEQAIGYVSEGADVGDAKVVTITD